MGETIVSVAIHGPQGAAYLDALADTGATFSKIPMTLAEDLGLAATHEVQVELGDGSMITRPLVLADVEVAGVRRPMLVATSQGAETPLLGYTALEILGFKVNPVTRSLEKTPAIEIREGRSTVNR